MTAVYLKGGERLAARLAEIGRNMNKAGSVKIGFLENATYPDGTSVAMVAAIQEFGAPSVGIPPRPFFRNMIAAHAGEWPDAAAALIKKNDYDTAKVLGQIGEGIAGQLRQSIVDLTDPPLKPSTIKRKGFDKPLVDTGHLLASVSYEVSGADGAATYTDPGMSGSYSTE